MKIMRRASDIEIGKFYRLRSLIDYGYVKPLQLIKPNTLVEGKKFTHWIVKCEHTVNKDDTCGFIRYFRIDDLAQE